MTCLAALSWAVLALVAVSGLYRWGEDNGYWGQGPGWE
jgi:hypothetical protein